MSTASICRMCFFKCASHVPGQHHGNGAAPSPAYVTDFVASSDGLALVKAFMRIKPEVRRRIVGLVEEIVGDEDN